jgi:hypothetical protein
MKKKPCCIVCGDTKRARPIKLAHGTIHICYNTCMKKLIFASEDSVPMLWAGREDFRDQELLTDEEMELLKPDDWIAMEGAMSDMLWNDDFFGDRFSAILKHGAVTAEYLIIKNTPKERLPLLLEHVKDAENKKYLHERLKGNEP